MGDCKPSEDLLAAFKKLRFSRANYSSALLLKVDKAKNSLEVDETFEETSLESVAQELEEGNPRFIIYSFSMLSVCTIVSFSRENWSNCF